MGPLNALLAGNEQAGRAARIKRMQTYWADRRPEVGGRAPSPYVLTDQDAAILAGSDAESVSMLNSDQNQACILSYKKSSGKKNQGNQRRLSGQGVLPLDGMEHTLDLECDAANVPKDGSCWAHAVLRSIHAVDIDELELRLPAWIGSGYSIWTAGFCSRLREWKAFGEQSKTSN
jgi:hypothetical protein